MMHNPNQTVFEMSSYLARLGVVPIINCGGMRSFYGNTVTLPEVVETMAVAAQSHIIMEELNEAANQRLAELTGFEAGIVTCGSAAGLFLAAAACTAGNDPERILGLPRNRGPKKAVLMPTDHRFSYDQAFRLAGLDILEVNSVSEATSKLETGTVALICFLGTRDERGPLRFEELTQLSKAYGSPIVVDAASEFLHRPNHWLRRGADLVVYSVGKYMRGPPATGLLLGRRDLVEAAWRNSAPQQAAGRCMKLGKDQILGALVAVEQWFAHDKMNTEMERCYEYLSIIANGLKEEPLLKTEVFETKDWSVPRLRVSWTELQAATHTNSLRETLLQSEPRILICDIGMTASSVLIDAFSLQRTDCEVVSEQIIKFFRSRTVDDIQDNSRPLTVDLMATWLVSINFSAGQEMHKFVIEKSGDEISGIHSGVTFNAPMEIQENSNHVEFTSKVPYEGVHLYYRFTGKVISDCLEGDVIMGAGSATNSGPVGAAQFGTAHWRAERTGPNS